MDLGVRKYKGNQRDLIIIDEEPELFSIFPCLPYEVGELVDRLSGLVHQEEVLPKDTKVIHKFTTALRSIQQRMERITDGAIREATYIPVDLVEDHEYQDVLKMTHLDLGKYLDQMSLKKSSDQYDRLMNTLSFLHAVSEGMGFHTRQGTSGFYAYKCVMSAEAGSVVLDGSADLNGVYNLCKGMELEDVPEVNYRNIQVTHVTPPNEFKNKMRPNGIMKNSWSAKPYIEWFKEFVLENTPNTSEILVVAKQDLLNFGLHKSSDDRYESPFEADWNGRHVHFCNYGRGRGSNLWKDCEYVFLLGDWHLPISTAIAEVGSLQSCPAKGLDLNKLGATRSKDPLIRTIKESHLLTTFKQMSARISLRNIDDNGVAQSAHVYSIDGDLTLLISWKERMFPNSPEIEYIGRTLDEGSSISQKFADLLLTTESLVLTANDLLDKCGLRSNMIVKALESRLVKPILKSRGWKRIRSMEYFGYGRGYLLVRGKENS